MWALSESTPHSATRDAGMMAPLRRAWLFHHSTGERKDQECVQGGAPKIAKLVYNSNNYGL